MKFELVPSDEADGDSATTDEAAKTEAEKKPGVVTVEQLQAVKEEMAESIRSVGEMVKSLVERTNTEDGDTPSDKYFTDDGADSKEEAIMGNIPKEFVDLAEGDYEKAAKLMEHFERTAAAKAEEVRNEVKSELEKRDKTIEQQRAYDAAVRDSMARVDARLGAFVRDPKFSETELGKLTKQKVATKSPDDPCAFEYAINEAYVELVTAGKLDPTQAAKREAMQNQADISRVGGGRRSRVGATRTVTDRMRAIGAKFGITDDKELKKILEKV